MALFKKGVSKKGKEKEDISLDSASSSYKSVEYKQQSIWGSAANVMIVTAFIFTIGLGAWYFFGNTIASWFGFSTEVIVDNVNRQKTNIEGEIENLQNQLNGETEQNAVIDSDIRDVDLENLPTEVGPGVYRVGYDIQAGYYLITRGSAFTFYADEYAVAQKLIVKGNEGTANLNWKEGDKETEKFRALTGNQLTFLNSGTYIEIVDGGMILNDSRPINDVKINESVILLADNDYVVGVDLPVGYYRVMATELQKGVGLNKGDLTTVLNGVSETVSIERQTYTDFALGDVLRLKNDAIFTRVDKKFIY